jgi:hypothetical protein
VNPYIHLEFSFEMKDPQGIKRKVIGGLEGYH